ncbi:prephenate dehydrogenase [Cesiribacter andamanensis]|uniref:Arogenate dehydrogenase n=1 Tax=Cesiribacter andamanensis AMV16 TaxID=1279009 RepID=M7NQS0_9BACT|nr:prephenate dehydrogenase [Cesiribacter andamanensis]EMR00839.1 Arogenate dehydrogenase [Cesiribacter andamanensis AMV16]
MKTVCIIGTGLIGGSMALDLRKGEFAARIIGVEQHAAHAADALACGLVDAVLPLEEALSEASLTILAIPVNAALQLLPRILDLLTPGAVVLDVGSTKAQLCAAVAHHPKRAQYVAAHPIAGTENSGPRAALAGLFQGKTNIICEQERSSQQALAEALALMEVLGMRTLYMRAEEHDKHLAYVSHLSHISSFVLSLTVLDIEKEEENIFALAGSGFASTARLAKSSPAMWGPIFEQNTAFLSLALQEYITHLQLFQQRLQQGNTPALLQMMEEANRIRPILEGKSRTPQPAL